MLTVEASTPCDDQPIDAASLMGENRFLTSWITPDNLEIQEKYDELTQGLQTQEQRITALWQYVKDIPYTRFVSSRVNVGGRSFARQDTWLDPAQCLLAPKLNCFNKSVLLASLLRQDLSENQVYVCLNNVQVDGVDGHAVTYLKLGEDYLLETTNPNIASPFLKARVMDAYEAVMWFTDSKVSYVPGISLREIGLCCVAWLEQYINEKLCTEYV